jgi:hypothetical protein
VRGADLKYRRTFARSWCGVRGSYLLLARVEVFDETRRHTVGGSLSASVRYREHLRRRAVNIAMLNWIRNHGSSFSRFETDLLKRDRVGVGAISARIGGSTVGWECPGRAMTMVSSCACCPKSRGGAGIARGRLSLREPRGAAACELDDGSVAGSTAAETIATRRARAVIAHVRPCVGRAPVFFDLYVVWSIRSPRGCQAGTTWNPGPGWTACWSLPSAFIT